MEIQHLKYFLKIAKNQHITKTATELGVSQSYLSGVVSQIEKEIGTPVFNRQGRNIVLNEAGEMLLHHAQIICSEMDAITRDAERLSGKNANLLRISSTSPRFFTDIINKFIENNPEARFLQSVNEPATLTNLLLEKELDFAISTPVIEHKDIKTIVLRQEKVFLAVHPGHRLYYREIIRLSECKNEKFISLSSNYNYYKMLEEFCRQAGFKFAPAIQVDYATLFHTSVLPSFVFFLPESLKDLSTVKKYKLLEIVEPECVRTLGLSFLEDRDFSPMALNFRHEILDYYS